MQAQHLAPPGQQLLPVRVRRYSELEPDPSGTHLLIEDIGSERVVLDFATKLLEQLSKDKGCMRIDVPYINDIQWDKAHAAEPQELDYACIAMMQFREASQAEAALHRLHGRTLNGKFAPNGIWGYPMHVTQFITKEQLTHPPNRGSDRVHLKGFDAMDLSLDQRGSLKLQLSEHFRQHGFSIRQPEEKWIYIPGDDGRCNALDKIMLAFVTLHSPEEAMQAAHAMNGKPLGGPLDSQEHKLWLRQQSKAEGEQTRTPPARVPILPDPVPEFQQPVWNFMTSVIETKGTEDDQGWGQLLGTIKDNHVRSKPFCAVHSHGSGFLLE